MLLSMSARDVNEVGRNSLEVGEDLKMRLDNMRKYSISAMV